MFVAPLSDKQPISGEMPNLTPGSDVPQNSVPFRRHTDRFPALLKQSLIDREFIRVFIIRWSKSWWQARTKARTNIDLA